MLKKHQYDKISTARLYKELFYSNCKAELIKKILRKRERDIKKVVK